MHLILFAYNNLFITKTKLCSLTKVCCIKNSVVIEQINKYGYLKLDYIKEHKKILYHELLIKNELTNYLLSVGKECENRYIILIGNYIKNGKKLTKKNKEINQMEWVKLMNNYKNMAD